MKELIDNYVMQETGLLCLDYDGEPDWVLTESHRERVATYAEQEAEKMAVEFGEGIRTLKYHPEQFTTAQLFELFKKERDEKR